MAFGFRRYRRQTFVVWASVASRPFQEFGSSEAVRLPGSSVDFAGLSSPGRRLYCE